MGRPAWYDANKFKSSEDISIGILFFDASIMSLYVVQNMINLFKKLNLIKYVIIEFICTMHCLIRIFH